MSIARIEEPEGDLLNVLEWLGPLEWRKYRGRFPEVRSRGRIERLDQSAYPPSFSFRFENEVGDVVKALRLAIESYNGKVRWTLEGRRRDTLGGANWTIRPARLSEEEAAASELNLTADQYFAQHKPEFGPVAYDDLAEFVAHIRQALGDAS